MNSILLSPHLGQTLSYQTPPTGMSDLARQNSIRVLFHGLMFSWFTANGDYVVGSYNGSSEHRRRLKVWERGQGSSPDKLIGDYVYGKNFNDDSILKLEVLSPLAGYERPGKFEPSAFNRLIDTSSVPNYRHHFRWSLNFGRELYGDHLSKLDNKVKPLFTTNSGLLYTACRSIPTVREEGGINQPLGRVAEFSAANVYFQRPVDSDLCALLRIDNRTANAFVWGRQYIVYWDNSCEPEECTADKELDMSQLNHALNRPSSRFVKIRNGIPCDQEDDISRDEQNDIDIRRAIQMHSLNLDASRFDPCGGGWIGQ